MFIGFHTQGDVFSFMVHLHASVRSSHTRRPWVLTQACGEMLQQAAAAFSAFEGVCTLVGVPAEFCGFGTTTLSPRRRCHKALTSEAQASPRDDVGDTPYSKIEHEGECVKEPCFPESSPCLSEVSWVHTSSSTSLVALLSLLAGVGSQGAHWGSWTLVQLRCGREGGGW